MSEPIEVLEQRIIEVLERCARPMPQDTVRGIIQIQDEIMHREALLELAYDGKVQFEFDGEEMAVHLVEGV